MLCEIPKIKYIAFIVRIQEHSKAFCWITIYVGKSFLEHFSDVKPFKTY